MTVCRAGAEDKLRDIIFAGGTTNAFPAVFAVILIAFHELSIKEGMVITDYGMVKKSLTGLNKRIETSRRATDPDERRKNVDTIKGLIAAHFVKADVSKIVYGNHAVADVESSIRRSEIELADYELKQGMLDLSDKRGVDSNLVEKVLKTICGIANNGKERVGKIIIGVTDKDSDAARVKQLDGIEPKKVGKRFVVGVTREAKVLGLTVEDYYARWKDAVKNSQLSPALRDAVLSHMDFNSYFGLGVILFTIPAQSELSFFADRVFWRNGDSTEEAVQAKQIAELAKRF